MMDLARELFPICRSITGDGFRRTLEILSGHVPIGVHEVPSGTPVFDWTVPPEWNIRDAYVIKDGERVIDFARSNLHVVQYSEPVRARMTLAELRPHLHSIPERPDWIPYRTAYYKRTWGFCIAHRELERLTEGEYEVCIDSTLSEGSLTYGEVFVPGRTDDEIVISCHACHPSLANDNLSGIAVACSLMQERAELPRKYGYRLLLIPGTIGSITWLALNEARVPRIRHGLRVSCTGDAGPITYKRTRRGDAAIDRAAELVLRDAGTQSGIVDFSPYGYDERQFSSPGFDLPFGALMRTANGEYPEYHTSADDLTLIAPERLEQTRDVCRAVLDVLERDGTYRNTNPKCEPQLGRRGLYEGLKGGERLPDYEMAMLWVLNLSDSSHSLVRIAERSGLPFDAVSQASTALEQAGLLEPVGG